LFLKSIVGVSPGRNKSTKGHWILVTTQEDFR
jgi:hypothetical protein